MPRNPRAPKNPEDEAAAGSLIPAGYDRFLGDLKERIRRAQIGAALAVNRELVLLYWQIGRDILQRQEHEGWGAKVIDRLARDLRGAFPEMKGFSPRNLKYVRTLSATYPDEHLCNGRLHNCPGHTMSFFSTRRRTPSSESGTCALLLWHILMRQLCRRRLHMFLPAVQPPH